MRSVTEVKQSTQAYLCMSAVCIMLNRLSHVLYVNMRYISWLTVCVATTIL